MLVASQQTSLLTSSVAERGVEPLSLSTADFKSAAFAISPLGLAGTCNLSVDTWDATLAKLPGTRLY